MANREEGAAAPNQRQRTEPTHNIKRQPDIDFCIQTGLILSQNFQES